MNRRQQKKANQVEREASVKTATMQQRPNDASGQ